MWKASAGMSGAAAPIASPSGGGIGASAAGGWHPTVLYMLGLVIAEIFVAGFLSRHLLA